MDPVVVFGPVIEPTHFNAIIDDTPKSYYKNGLVNDVTWVTGVNSGEGVLRAGGKYIIYKYICIIFY